MLSPMLLLLMSCGSTGTSTTSTTSTSSGTYTLSLGAEATVLDTATRTADGFAFGPPDGTVGALAQGSGKYMFFMSANSSAACTGSPSTEGTYRMGGTLSSFTSSYGCSAVIRKASQGIPIPMAGRSTATMPEEDLY